MMGMTTQWRTRGRAADVRDLAEALALARQYQHKLSILDREIRERDADARRVGAAIRKNLRDQARGRFPLNCRPAPVSGQRKSGGRIRSFETMVGLLHPKRSYVAKDGFSSFHCKFTSRGLGDRRRARNRPYTRGEAIRTVRYILREAAREFAGGGVISSIGADPDEIASLFGAIEELERTAGRTNANVYMSLVISLPHELDGRREALLARICEPFAEHDLPYAAVLHDPDPNGDKRNYHAHVIFSLRPFRKEADGSYSFSAATCADLNDAAFIQPFRVHAAEVMNQAMADAALPRRFTSLSRAERGLASAPAGAGKDSPGKKHHDRRHENIALGKAERDWIEEHVSARSRLAEALKAIAVREPNTRNQRIAALQQAERTIVAATAAKPTVFAASTAAVSQPSKAPLPERQPPIAATATEIVDPADRGEAPVDAAVAHAQPRPATDARIIGRVAQPAVANVGPTPSDRSEGSGHGVATADVVDAQAGPADRDRTDFGSAGPSMLISARDEARRRMKTVPRRAVPDAVTQSPDGPTSSSRSMSSQSGASPPPEPATPEPVAMTNNRDRDDWSREHSPVDVDPADSTNEATRPAAEPPSASPVLPTPQVGTADQRVRRLVRQFRRSPAYRQLSDADRQAIDAELQMPVRYLLNGSAILKLVDGRLRASVVSPDVQDAVRRLASTAPGWALLVTVARSLPDLMRERSDWGWETLARPSTPSSGVVGAAQVRGSVERGA